jgi:LL-diaminopimelate aminotransferase
MSGSVIVFDAAYQSFVRGNYPRSIFAIAGARECAIEVNSFSKSCGFTGLRCGFMIVPQKTLRRMWEQRQSIKFNGVPYIVQRAAEAALSPAGIKQCGEQVAYYLENAKILAEFLEARGAQFYGGVNSPYIWLRCPEGETSWGYFDRLLHEFQIVVTPGAGFGSCGEGYVRLSAFAPREDILEVIKRLGKNIWKV